MGLSPQLITDDVHKDLKKAYQATNKISRRGIRLKVMITAKENGVWFAAKAFDLSRGTIVKWVHRFIEEGVNGLDYKQGRGRKSHLKKEHHDAIKKWTQENHTITLRELVIKIEDEFPIQTSQSAVNRVSVFVNKVVAFSSSKP